MDENELNNLSKKLFENYKLQRPPEDFTDKLMLRIEEAKNPVKQEKKVLGSKFMMFFIVTFSSLTLLGYILRDKSASSKSGILDKVDLTYFDLEKLTKLFNFHVEIGLFAKLIIGSIIVLVIIDLLTGSVIDYFIDSKSKKKAGFEN
jgi:hypothetical protein